MAGQKKVASIPRSIAMAASPSGTSTIRDGFSPRPPRIDCFPASVVTSARRSNLTPRKKTQKKAPQPLTLSLVLPGWEAGPNGDLSGGLPRHLSEQGEHDQGRLFLICASDFLICHVAYIWRKSSGWPLDRTKLWTPSVSVDFLAEPLRADFVPTFNLTLQR